MAGGEGGKGAVQDVQAQHRRNLAGFWEIAPGANVLEIGCGQGDMTAVLAEAVGPDGHVMAIDAAAPDYGSPLTLGQATDLLKASPLGERIDFRFEFDLLDPSTDFAPDQFDYVVFAHSSWYFSSGEQLQGTLVRLRPWAKSLLFAEWDLAPTSLEQLPHMLAVMIQGQVEAFKAESEANVRTPLSRSRLKAIIEAAGWSIAKEATIDAELLQDADWEIRACFASSLEEAKAHGLPPRLIAMLQSQIEVLKQIAPAKGARSLDCFAAAALRA